MASLPSYVAAARPVPAANRAAWYKNVAPTYAGIMLWFVFWKGIVGGEGTPGGVLSAGLGTALLGVVIAALICHFLFYLVPGLLGMRTGLPLYVVGTSTYGAWGGLFMPGFLMGLLQFGWLAVNASAVAGLLCQCFGMGLGADGITPAVPGWPHGVIAAVYTAVCAFIGLKGIQYVARVATYLPLIPLVVLVVLLVKTSSGLESFTPSTITAPTATAAKADVIEEASLAEAEADAQIKAPRPLPLWGVLAILSTYVVGFFATAGAAGTDIASNSRNTSDVQWGGLTGVALATIFAGCLAILIVAGAYGAGIVPKALAGNLNPLDLMKGGILSEKTANIIMILLAISSIPPACFSAMIAANSFKTTLPNVNPFVSVGLGTLVAAALAVSGIADKAITVFVVIGASFGPVCGAMVADYLLAGRKWAGPRAGFNMAGWVSWIVGFAVGAFNLIAENVPALADYRGVVCVPPVSAFVVGFVLYAILAKIGLESRKLEMPGVSK